MATDSMGIATASAIAGIVGRLVRAPTSHVVAGLLRGELPHRDGVPRADLRALVDVLSRPSYLLGSEDDLCEATAALGRALGLEVEMGRRLLQRGLLVTGQHHRVFLRTGSTQAVREEVGRASSPEKTDLELALPWDPWQVLDAIAPLLDLTLPAWEVDADTDQQGRLWGVEADAATIAAAGGHFFSDDAHAMVVQLGDLVARLATIAAETAERNGRQRPPEASTPETSTPPVSTGPTTSPDGDA
jgi:hypothetical protein